MRITVLGKSPAWQDADGACSGYLVQGGGQVVLLDCGPGVFAKLRRYVDYAAVDAVVISHLHADHILDLVPFASGLRYGPRKRGRAAAADRAAGRAWRPSPACRRRRAMTAEHIALAFDVSSTTRPTPSSWASCASASSPCRTSSRPTRSSSPATARA